MPIKPGSDPEPAGSSSEASGADGSSDDESAIDAGTTDENAVNVPTSKSGERSSSDASAKPSATAKPRKRKRAPAKGGDRLVGNLDKAMLLLAKAVAFGLIAGAAGVLAAIVLRQYDNSSSEVPARLAELSGRLEALEGKVAAVDEAAAVAAQSVASGLDEARSEREAINSARSQAESSLESMSAGIEDRLAKLESAAQAAGAAGSGVSERLASLDGKVAALEERLVAPSGNSAEGVPDGADAAPRAGAGAVRSSGISDLLQRVAVLEAASSGGGQDEISQRLDGLDGRISALEDMPADESTKAALDALVELESLSRQVETLREELASSEELPPRALALIGVRAAAATGAPFKSLLADAGIGGEELPDALREHGETGVATMADLRESFPAAARAAQRAANAEADTQGIVDGFLGLFESAVQVRPLEPVEGDDVPALLSRAESMVRGNRLAEAMDLLAALPEPGMAAMAGWLQSARARLDVLAAIDGLLNESGAG